MIEHIKEWILVFTLAAFLIGGLAYNHWHDPDAGAKKLRDANIQACQRGLAKAQVFKAFTDAASTARRASAASEAANGDSVAAQNDIAAAEKYESLGKQWMDLTPTDCQSQYPTIP